jgi:hypothetical protein
MHFGFMNVILLCSYRSWLLCNKCCTHVTEVHLLVFFVIFFLYSSLCLFFRIYQSAVAVLIVW